MSINFITLSCPSCGAKLSITPDIDRFACLHCGQEHIIKRGDGIVSLSPVVGAINQIGVGVDRVAAEMAIQRLPKEIEDIQNAKFRFAQQNPEPKLGIWSYLALVPGAFMTIGLSASISGTLNERTPFSYFALAIFGILPLLIAGILVYRFHREKMKYWQTFTVSKYREFDEQIGKRQLQLKKYQDLLSQ